MASCCCRAQPHRFRDEAIELLLIPYKLRALSITDLLRSCHSLRGYERYPLKELRTHRPCITLFKFGGAIADEMIDKKICCNANVQTRTLPGSDRRRWSARGRWRPQPFVRDAKKTNIQPRKAVRISTADRPA